MIFHNSTQVVTVPKRNQNISTGSSQHTTESWNQNQLGLLINLNLPQSMIGCLLLNCVMQCAHHMLWCLQ